MWARSGIACELGAPSRGLGESDAQVAVAAPQRRCKEVSFLKFLGSILGVLILSLLLVVPALAQGQTSSQPVQQSAAFAQLRAKYEGKSLDQLKAMGYTVNTHDCVQGPPGAGAMGIHIINPQYYGAQFPAGKPNADQPPVALVNTQGTVVGVEWEAKNVGQGQTTLWGQPVTLQPGHPGVPYLHYMLHAYFYPNGRVLFTPFNPQLSCPKMPSTGGGGMSAAAGTGSGSLPVGGAAAAALLLLGGYAATRRISAGS